MERYFGSFLKETYRRDSTWNYYEMIGSFCLVLNMLGLFYALMVSFSSNHQVCLLHFMSYVYLIQVTLWPVLMVMFTTSLPPEVRMNVKIC